MACVNDILDAAAVRSARALLAASRTPVGRRLQQRTTELQKAVVQTRSIVEPRLEEKLRTLTGAIGRVRRHDPAETPTAEARRHHEWTTPDGSPELTAQAVRTPGDDERCTCQGVGGDWCGATRRDVVDDLMHRGMHLSLEQAEHIWTTAQAKRADGE